MFTRDYFPAGAFAPDYFPPVEDTVPPVVPPPSGYGPIRRPARRVAIDLIDDDFWTVFT